MRDVLRNIDESYRPPTAAVGTRLLYDYLLSPCRLIKHILKKYNKSTKRIRGSRNRKTVPEEPGGGGNKKSDEKVRTLKFDTR